METSSFLHAMTPYWRGCLFYAIASTCGCGPRGEIGHDISDRPTAAVTRGDESETLSDIARHPAAAARLDDIADTQSLACDDTRPRCLPGTSFRDEDDCNDCMCPPDGLVMHAACTVKDCDPHDHELGPW